MLKKLLARLKRDERGLTLVELLAVIVILAVVGGIATVSIGNVIENSKKDAHIANALQLISAAKLHEATTGESIGSAGIDLKGLQDEKLLENIFDPWKKEAYLDTGSKVVYDETNGYQATLATKTTGTDTECQISGKKEEELLKGRDACTATPPVGGGG